MRLSFDKQMATKKKAKDNTPITLVTLIDSDKYADWQVKMLEYFKEVKMTKATSKEIDWKTKVNEIMAGQDKKKVPKAFEFGSIMIVK